MRYGPSADRPRPSPSTPGPPAVLFLCRARRTVRGRGHRRCRRPCSAGSDECLPGFGARVVGLSSTSSMTSVRPAGIGPCMSPGRMGICRSDGWGSISFVRRGVASCPRELEISSPVRRVTAARRPGLEPGTSSLSGSCTRACFPRRAPATCANDLPLETAGDRCEPLGSDGMWTKRGPGRLRSIFVASGTTAHRRDPQGRHERAHSNVGSLSIRYM